MSNLDTPKAIIVAALIMSATIMFTFRYSFHVPGWIAFNHLTGTATFVVPSGAGN
jgi:hypothetical protein